MNTNSTSPADKENQLFDGIRCGDRLSFDTLFRMMYAPLCHYAFLILKSKEDAEEIVQECFIYLWENACNIKINTSAKSYLYTMVRNRSLNFYKKVNQTEINNNDYLKTFYSDTDGVDSLNVELIKQLPNAINSLPEKCKEIFLLRKIEGLSYIEIGKILDISEKPIENQITIAIKKLREFLKPHLNNISYIIVLMLVTSFF